MNTQIKCQLIKNKKNDVKYLIIIVKKKPYYYVLNKIKNKLYLDTVLLVPFKIIIMSYIHFI